MADDALRSRRPYKDLSLTQLRSFCEVCRVGSYAAAARDLLLTSPAVWEQLQALERHYDVPLLERHGNGVRPTLHGLRLLELVRPLLAGLESTRGVLHQSDSALPDQLTIVSNLRVLVEEISRAMFQFQSRYPSVRLEIRYTNSKDVETLVSEGIADVTLTLEPAADESISSAIVYQPAGELDYLLVTPPKHPLLRKKSNQLQAIVGYPLVLSARDAYSRHRVQEVFHRHNLTGEVKIAVETSSDEYTLACVRAGLGVGIAIGNSSSTLYRDLGVRSLREWFGSARVGFMWRSGAYIPRLQSELAELLRNCVTGCQ